MNDEPMIENRTFDEIAVGDTASLARTLREEDIQLFALVSGDVNPAHVDPDYGGDYTKVTHPHAKRERMVNVTRRATN